MVKQTIKSVATTTDFIFKDFSILPPTPSVDGNCSYLFNKNRIKIHNEKLPTCQIFCSENLTMG